MEVERRKSKRISTKVVADCLRSGSGDLKDTIFFTRDLSPDGARGIIRGEANIGESFTLILHLPSFLFPLLIVGEMRWIKDISASGCRIPNIKEVGIKTEGSSLGIAGQKNLTKEKFEEAVRKKAYELYIKRGCICGNELGDWLEAEKLVKKEYKIA